MQPQVLLQSHGQEPVNGVHGLFGGHKVNDIELFQGDCLELLKGIPDGSIDLTVTSPPYDNLRTYNGNISQWSFEKFKDIARELYRVTVKGGVVVWIVADATVKGSETGTSFKQALWFKECGFNLHDTMIYQKDSISYPDTKRYYSNFEYQSMFLKTLLDLAFLFAILKFLLAMQVYLLLLLHLTFYFFRI